MSCASTTATTLRDGGVSEDGRGADGQPGTLYHVCRSRGWDGDGVIIRYDDRDVVKEADGPEYLVKLGRPTLDALHKGNAAEVLAAFFERANRLLGHSDAALRGVPGRHPHAVGVETASPPVAGQHGHSQQNIEHRAAAPQVEAVPHGGGVEVAGKPRQGTAAGS